MILVIWIARYLGPEKFGLLNYAQSFASFFIILSRLGLDTIVIRDLVLGKNDESVLLGSSFILKSIGAFISLALLSVAIFAIPGTSYERLLIFLVASSAIFQAFGVIDFYFQSEVLSRYIVISNLITLTLSSLLKFYLVFTEAPLEFFAAVAIFDSIVSAICFALVYHIHGRRFLSWKYDRRVAARLLMDSWPLIFSGLLVMVYLRIDQLMIKHLLDVNAVGQYAAAVRLSEAWYVVPMAITASLFPAIVGAKEKSEAIYMARLQQLYDLMVWLAIAVCLLVLLAGGFIISTLYGQMYLASVDIFKLHIISSIFGNIGLVSNRYFSAENMQKQLLYRSILGVTINVLLNYFLIQRYGATGAALAIVITQISTSLLYTYIDKRTRKLFFMSIQAFNVIRIVGYLKEFQTRSTE